MSAEDLKVGSRHLRGTVAEELHNEASHFSADAMALLKFHGTYQQDDRDHRRERTAARQELDYSCMVRTSLPGGQLTAEQYLAADALADEVADGSLRITTRQDLQFHFVRKGNLHGLIHRLNEGLVSTLAACGDVVRNVVCCPADVPGRNQAEIMASAQSLSRYFKPRSRAYYELWIDGEKAVTAGVPDGEDEPIYGEAYLPRKFKIGLAFPGDNCIDVYSQDLGFIPIDGGFDVVVGGGMGQSHAREDDTYPRLASPLVWIAPEDLAAVAEAVIGIHRDFGNREDRQRARLKYVVDERGSEWFRAEVERRVGHALADYVPLPAWDTEDHLGWWKDAKRRWTLGVPVPSGRINGELKVALRAVVATWKPEVRLTTRQDILLCGFTAAQKAKVDAVLAEHGVRQVDELRPLERLAMACPALPTCGQALGESERVMPELLDGIHAVLEAAGLGALPVHLNMTGCPNGCARPYTSEIGIVGRTKSTYDVYLGGAVGGDRMNERLAVGVKLADIPKALAGVVERYAAEAKPDEGFGDYCARVGVSSFEVKVEAPRRRPRQNDAA